MISRITDDYERMAVAGVVAITEPSFWLGEPRKYAGTFYDYFDHITGFERERAAQYGIQHFIRNHHARKTSGKLCQPFDTINEFRQCT